MQPIALMVPVPGWEAGFAWYQRAFPDAEVISLPEFDFRVLRSGNFLIEVVNSDEKVPSGMSGTILYWEVDDLQEAIDRFLDLGSHIHRGPVQIEFGMGMCQLSHVMTILRVRTTGFHHQTFAVLSIHEY